jgi:hypothetical protein
MVESICGQGFAYAREVVEERLRKTSQTRAKGSYRKDGMRREGKLENQGFESRPSPAFL